MLIYLFAWASLVVSCDSRDYLSSKEFEDGCWAVTDVMNFEQDLQTAEMLSLHLKFNTEYRFQNIYLQISVKNPQGKETEIVHNEILSDPLGEWKVEASGKNYLFDLTDLIEIPFTQAGTYTFSVAQYMREEKLCGIEKVGILR
ncbi:MAG: gliding motility lipoprotein GldH [Bacteroidota bacterium]